MASLGHLVGSIAMSRSVTTYLGAAHDTSTFKAWYAEQIKGQLDYLDIIRLTVTDNPSSATAKNELHLWLHYPVENMHREHETTVTDPWIRCSSISYNSTRLPEQIEFSTSSGTTIETSINGSIGVSVDVLELSLGCDLTHSATILTQENRRFTVPANKYGAVVAMPFHKEFDAVYDAYGPNGFIGTKTNHVRTFASRTKELAEAIDGVVGFKVWRGPEIPENWMPDPEE